MPRTPQARERVVVERAEIRPVDPYAARIRPIEPRDEIEQRGFADARLAADGHELAPRDMQGESVQHHAMRSAAERLANAGQLDHAGSVANDRAIARSSPRRRGPSVVDVAGFPPARE